MLCDANGSTTYFSFVCRDFYGYTLEQEGDSVTLVSLDKMASFCLLCALFSCEKDFFKKLYDSYYLDDPLFSVDVRSNKIMCSLTMIAAICNTYFLSQQSLVLTPSSYGCYQIENL